MTVTDRFIALRAAGFSVERARALAEGGYTVVGLVPIGWVPLALAGGR